MGHDSTALAKHTVQVDIGQRGVMPQTLDELYRVAKAAHISGICPRGDTPETVMIKMMAAMERGLPLTTALGDLVVVKGRLSLMGSAALALIRSSKVCKFVDVGCEGEGDARAGYMRFQRHDMPEPVKVTFTMAEAKRAGLTTGNDVWKLYTDTMLIWRAVGKGGKFYFSDVLAGLEVAEVARDLPPKPTVSTEQPVAGALPSPEPDPIIEGTFTEAEPVAAPQAKEEGQKDLLDDIEF